MNPRTFHTEPGSPLQVQCLRLRGELDLTDLTKIAALLSEYMTQGLVLVVLDLSHVNHIHLAGLPMLVNRAQRLREYGGDLKLAGASEYVKHLFELAGYVSQFDFCANEDDAMRRISGDRPPRKPL